MSRIALIVYHKNAATLYPKEWIDRFKESIFSQTHNKFRIFECNYGGDDYKIFYSNNSIFENTIKNNFVEVMNSMIESAFNLRYDYVFNCNIDDYFSPDRIEKQLVALKNGYDIVSSNFALVDRSGNEIHRQVDFHKLNINEELNKGHNIICHPCVAYSRKFWQDGNRYVPGEIPFEDLNLWKRSIGTNKFLILEDVLCYHRIHDKQVSGENTNRNIIT